MSSFNRAPKPRIGEILIDMGLVTEEQVQQALGVQETTKDTLGSIMIDHVRSPDDDITPVNGTLARNLFKSQAEFI